MYFRVLKPVSMLLIAVFILSAFPSEAQCAMCKQAAETSMKDNPDSMARNLNSGILYLMAVPYIMIAFIFRKQLFALWRKFSGRAFARRA